MPQMLSVPPPSPEVSIVNSLGTWSDIASNLAQVIAIVIGASWAYLLFVRHREKWPRATLEHKIQHIDLANEKRLLRVVEKVTNTGAVLLRLATRMTWVQQILPADAEALAQLETTDRREADWPLLGRIHHVEGEPRPPVIEPGESDHFEHDFPVEQKVDVVQVYSYFHNVRRNRWWRRLSRRKDDRGWTLTTIYDFRVPGQTTNRMEDISGKEGNMPQKKESQQQPKQRPSVKQQGPKPVPQAKPQKQERSGSKDQGAGGKK